MAKRDQGKLLSLKSEVASVDMSLMVCWSFDSRCWLVASMPRCGSS